MKISVFTVMLPDLTPEEAVAALKAAGYDGVEWRVTHIPETRRGEPPSFWGNNLCTFAPTAAEARRARILSESAHLALPNLGTYISVGDLPPAPAMPLWTTISPSSATPSPWLPRAPRGVHSYEFTETAAPCRHWRRSGRVRDASPGPYEGFG
jgi:hypothetical protein